jgi:hypothetical protein
VNIDEVAEWMQAMHLLVPVAEVAAHLTALQKKLASIGPEARAQWRAAQEAHLAPGGQYYLPESDLKRVNKALTAGTATPFGAGLAASDLLKDAKLQNWVNQYTVRLAAE